MLGVVKLTASRILSMVSQSTDRRMPEQCGA